MARNAWCATLAAAPLIAPPAWADLPLDKYQEAVKDSATSAEAQAFLNGYFIGLAAGLVPWARNQNRRGY
ncbi:MAG: hypothetical protein AB7M05_10035 [Alphaproteobacteria bacterium]